MEEETKEGTINAGEEKQNKSDSKPPEPQKDYIHVRARRGQATDSHSLAERVRITAFCFSINFFFFCCEIGCFVSRDL